MMEKKVEDFLKKHQLLRKHSTIIIGVSGGPDSMALLHFLYMRREVYNYTLVAVTVDHQLRGAEAQADVEYVRRICAKWRITFESAQINVRKYMQANKVGTQVAARVLRYEVFENMMGKYAASYLALGHHGDDQVETMLMGLMQRTNAQGLQGIPYKRSFVNGEIVRPLLAVTKSEIEAYCTSYSIEPRIDSSNADTDYTRNDLRLRVVPVLKEKNNQLHKTVQQLSETIQEDEHYLQQQTMQVVRESITFAEKNTEATISLKNFLMHAVSLQRRALRLTLEYLYEHIIPEKISYTHEQIFLELLTDNVRNKVIHFPHNLMVEKSYDVVYLYFKRTTNHPSFHHAIPTLPFHIMLPNGAILKGKEVPELPEDKDYPRFFTYPKQAIDLPLHIRNRKQGDRMTHKGLRGSKKIKNILIDEKIPRHERDQMYLITDNEDDVLWLIGLRKKALDPYSNGPYILFEYIKSTN